MRISDLSSYVCSSDLNIPNGPVVLEPHKSAHTRLDICAARIAAPDRYLPTPLLQKLAPCGIFVGCKQQIRYRPADDRDGRTAKQGFGRRIPIMDLPSRTENNDDVGGNIRETRFLGGHRI